MGIFYIYIYIYIYCVALKTIPTSGIFAQASLSHSRSKPTKHHKPHKPFRRAISLRSGLCTTSRPATSHRPWRTSRRTSQNRIRKKSGKPFRTSQHGACGAQAGRTSHSHKPHKTCGAQGPAWAHKEISFSATQYVYIYIYIPMFPSLLSHKAPSSYAILGTYKPTYAQS